MIAIVRKNFASLISIRNWCACKSPVSFSLSPHYFSTWKKRPTLVCPRIFDLLFHKHHFSHPVASLVASDLARPKNPETADSVLSFLKESGCLSSQLEKIVGYNPRILSFSVDELKLKIKIFQELGFSPKEIAKILSCYTAILHSSVDNKIIPSLSLLKGLLGSDRDVARLLRKSAWFLYSDLEKSLLPNVEFLKSIGISMERILFLIYTFPRCLLSKPNAIRKSVDKAREMGFRESSKMFVYAVHYIAPISEGMWKVKIQFFRDLGFSDQDIMTMFRKAPQVMYKSKKKVVDVKDLLLGTRKFNISSIVTNPSAIGCSIEKRLKPRLQILGILESEKLIQKWPALGTICRMPDHKFFLKFIEPYPNEVAKYWRQRV